MGKNTKPPLVLCGLSATLSGLGLLTGVVLGGSLAGYLVGLLGTVIAFFSLYVNRQRQTHRDYDHSFSWFQTATSTAYVVGVVATVVHIIRYAIELGNA